MTVRRALFYVVTSLLLSTSVFAQSHPTLAALPNDPLELATGPAKVLDTPQLRAMILGLVEQARQNNGMHMAGGAPFDLKATFTSTRRGKYLVDGDLEETWLNGRTWRWTAHLGDYSIDRIFYQGSAFDQKSAGPVPLRIHMVRAAVFWPVSGNFAPAYLRVATAKWGTEDLMCVLRSRGPEEDEMASDENAETANSQGRRWGEREYCIDPKTGMLRTYSEAPGVYTLYEYGDQTIHFHGRSLSQHISVVEGGETVLQIHIDSLEDPHVADPNFFMPSQQMLRAGPQATISGVFRFSQIVPIAGRAGIQPTIVIATIDNKGKVEEAETPPTSETGLSEAALSLVKGTQYAQQRDGPPRQRLAYIEVKFVPGK